jgi:hypothetical protein
VRVLKRAVQTASVVLACAACRQGTPLESPVAAATARGEPVQAIYSDDLNDPWNRLFSEMFTRTVRVRKTSDLGESGPFAAVPRDEFPRFSVSERTYDRLEDGDRAVSPFYPTFIQLAGMPPAITSERLGRLARTLTDALADTRPRGLVDRVLMQADLWAMFDRLGGIEARVCPLLAQMIARIAPARTEIASLPDHYDRARRHLDLPDLFSSRSDWQEIVWFDRRTHDGDARFRQATRVFVRPPGDVTDRAAFFNELRYLTDGPYQAGAVTESRGVAALKQVAGATLAMQILAIDTGGEIVATPLFSTVQVRSFGTDASGKPTTVTVEHELSRKQLRTDPASGGFRTSKPSDPAYIPSAGNDYSFAQPHLGMIRDPILGTLAARCGACHGTGPHLFTFALSHAEDGRPVTLLPQPNDARTRFVAEQKRQREEFKRLRALLLEHLVHERDGN